VTLELKAVTDIITNNVLQPDFECLLHYDYRMIGSAAVFRPAGGVSRAAAIFMVYFPPYDVQEPVDPVPGPA